MKTQTQQLLEKFDELSNLWIAAEKQLAALYTPVECYYVFDKWQEGADYSVERAIGWIKFRSNWRLCLGTLTSDNNEGQWRPVTDCSAIDRVEAVPFFVTLKEKLEGETAGFLDRMSKSIDELKKQVT